MIEKKRKRKEKRNKQKLETHKNKNNFDSYNTACPRISRGLSRPGQTFQGIYARTSCYREVRGLQRPNLPRGLRTGSACHPNLSLHLDVSL